MHAKVIAVDLVKDDALIHFDDGASTLFAARFLYEHRDDNDNKQLTGEEDNPSKAD